MSAKLVMYIFPVGFHGKITQVQFFRAFAACFTYTKHLKELRFAPGEDKIGVHCFHNLETLITIIHGLGKNTLINAIDENALLTSPEAQSL
jgi:hypothetical protein